MAQSICIQRLTEERRQWRKDHPYGVYARPDKIDKGIDLTSWSVGIPGKKGTDWEGGVYHVKIKFPSKYPQDPPKCTFAPPLFHPNVYEDGDICLSILNPEEDWKPSITLKQLLLGIQELLDNPNPFSPAQTAAYVLFQNDKHAYAEKIKAQALKFTPTDE